MATTLVGIFDEQASAQRAAQQLTQIGIKQSDIQVMRNEESSSSTALGTSSSDRSSGTGSSGGIAGFFDRLFGGDNDSEDRGIYSEAVRRGSTAVTVDVEESMVDRAADILNDCGAVDVDERAAHYRATGYQSFNQNQPPYTADDTRAEMDKLSAGGKVALPVIEEELRVGKREVQRGRVRVHTRVTERPVEEQVQLREEHVRVERRPADREATQADLSQIREGEMTLTETAEEAVVAKQARVVEEVVVGKESTERTETVKDSVRRTDVDVDNVTESQTTTAKPTQTTAKPTVRTP